MTYPAPATVSTASQLTLEGLIAFAHAHKACDIFLKAGTPPGMKVLGRIERMPYPALDEADTRRLAEEKMTAEQRARYEQTGEMNLSFSVPGVARIRQNAYRERDCCATTCRLIPLSVRSLEEIGVHAPAIRKMTEAHDGLVLVTGPTGSGKSTTLAGMIDHINATRSVNIITIEDPIEYVYQDKQALISQRQIGTDTQNFGEALRQVLRQTPDVILIGEMRDLETVNVALQAAETGHLVFGTLHTSSAAETLDRLSNMFAPHERAMLFLRLSLSLRGVVSQKLLRRADGSGRVVAQEIMVTTPSIEKMLAEGRSSDLYNAIRQDGDERYWGMCTMNQCLAGLVDEKVVTEDEALAKAGVLSELRQMLRRAVMLQVAPPDADALPPGSLFATEPAPPTAPVIAPKEDDGLFVLRRAS